MNLVTGATGLLGSHIVEQLRKRGQPVRVLVRPGSDRSWLTAQNVEFAEGDITDPASLRQACAGVEVVYHAAAKVGDWGPWEEFERVTIGGTRNVIAAAVRSDAVFRCQRRGSRGKGSWRSTGGIHRRPELGLGLSEGHTLRES
jgi:nucleoside-diphosphate-sugar epimerase